MAEEAKPVCTVAAGAGFAGDRIDPAVALAASGQVDAIGLECLAERTLVPAIAARRANPEAGADPRLRDGSGHRAALAGRAKLPMFPATPRRSFRPGSESAIFR